jgi:3',5'-cyclic AMP phosphodiesterase CpdA
MTRIAHISDIHFGRDIPSVITGLVADVQNENPDLTIISGDFTQRARAQEFLHARHLIESLPAPVMTIPGNHDLPLFNVFSRFLLPRRNYKRFISTELETEWVSEDCGVIAVDSTKEYLGINGELTDAQIHRTCERLAELGPDRVKIVVTHHPYAAPATFNQKMLIGRAKRAMKRFGACGADVFLAGHLHISYAGFSGERYPHVGRNMLMIMCGTSASDRGRGEPNSYNLLEIDKGTVTLKRKWWDDEAHEFYIECEQAYEKRGVDWTEVDEMIERHTLVTPTETEMPPPRLGRRKK